MTKNRAQTRAGKTIQAAEGVRRAQAVRINRERRNPTGFPPSPLLFPCEGSAEFAHLKSAAQVGQIILGRDGQGAEIKLSLEAAAHTMVSGSVGAGTTVLLTIPLFWSLYLSDQYEAVVCDPNGTHRWAKDLGARYAQTSTEIAEAVKYAHARMQQNQELLVQHAATNLNVLRLPKGTPHLRRVLVLFDGLPGFMLSDPSTAMRAMTLLERIVQEGRSTGVSLFVTAQHSTGDLINPALADNLGHRVALGWMPEPASRLAIGSALSNSEVMRRAPRGCGWFVSPASEPKSGMTFLLPANTARSMLLNRQA